MRSLIKYFSNFMSSFIAIVLVLVLLNTLLFGFIFQQTIFSNYGDTAPKKMLEAVHEAAQTDRLPVDIEEKIVKNNLWVIYLDNKGKAYWTVNVPRQVPTTYTLQDVAVFSKGYIKDYPVFIRNTKDGLIVLGYPINSYTKIISNYFPIQAIKRLPYFFFVIILFDALCLFYLYYSSKRKFTKKTEPIIAGIEGIAEGKPVTLKTDEEFKNITDSINRASMVLNKQNIARANWIDGVSHDIRTPLSIIMGYASRISDNDQATEKIKKQALMIQNQSLTIKELIQDLNIVSKLEYEMQPINTEKIRFSKLLRTYVTDVLNSIQTDRYTIELEIQQNAENVVIEGDSRLITRAITNLVNNSMKHNPKGCNIFLYLFLKAEKLTLTVTDDGLGISEEKLAELGEKPHYMDTNQDRLDLRHGLGLLIVRQIVHVHHGHFEIYNVSPKGCQAVLSFPNI